MQRVIDVRLTGETSKGPRASLGPWFLGSILTLKGAKPKVRPSRNSSYKDPRSWTLHVLLW